MCAQLSEYVNICSNLLLVTEYIAGDCPLFSALLLSRRCYCSAKPLWMILLHRRCSLVESIIKASIQKSSRVLAILLLDLRPNTILYLLLHRPYLTPPHFSWDSAQFNLASALAIKFGSLLVLAHCCGGAPFSVQFHPMVRLLQFRARGSFNLRR